MSAGVGAYAGGVGCVLQSIIRNTFGYVAISIVSNRKTSFYVIAEKWLKRTYIMNGRERRREEGEIEKAACSAGAGSVLSAAVLYGHTVISVKQTTQTPLNML